MVYTVWCLFSDLGLYALLPILAPHRTPVVKEI